MASSDFGIWVPQSGHAVVATLSVDTDDVGSSFTSTADNEAEVSPDSATESRGGSQAASEAGGNVSEAFEIGGNKSISIEIGAG
jgi:hypothetical protein